MKKIYKVLVGVATLTLGVTLLAGCNTDKESNLADQQVYSFSTITGAQLNRMSTLNLETDPITDPETNPITDPVVEEDIDEVNYYVNLLEPFISNPITVSEPVASDLLDEEGNPIYEWMVTYQVVNALGEKDEYVFHYTEEVIYDSTLVVADEYSSDELDVNEDDTDELDIDDDDSDELDVNEDDDDNETIKITRLTGVMILGDETFEVTGRTKIELEDDETEVETIFMTKRSEDRFVIVKYEKEIEEGEIEEKFFISEHNNGLVRHTMIQIEQEDDEYSFNLQYRDRITGEFKKIKIESADDDSNYDFVIKYMEHSEDEILSGKILVDVIVDEVTGETSYEYEVVNSIEHERRNGDNMKYRGERHCN